MPGHRANLLSMVRPGSPAMRAAPLLFLCCAIAQSGSHAADRPTPSDVVATVGGEPIYSAELACLVGKALAGKQVDDAALRIAQDQVLSGLVSRRLVLAYARRTQTAPSDARIDAEVAALAKQLAARGSSLDQFLAEQSIDRDGLRRQLTWNVVWPQYLERYVTEDRAKVYFDEHRRTFDGTELSVRHILLRSASSGSEAIEDTLRKAREIRQAILAGKISFEEAVRKHSTGPSAEHGGTLGWIGRRGPMLESFTRAAFALKAGEISEPVQTPFGVHLIRCDEVKPGTRQLDEVRGTVNEALARELLEKLARNERQYTPVEYARQATTAKRP
ncbi:MAG: peptidylprolyl isomerase [Pirellulales bacterium]|nr:peptidylprolyl isomerase [Pirellulales bacterium]